MLVNRFWQSCRANKGQSTGHEMGIRRLVSNPKWQPNRQLKVGTERKVMLHTWVHWRFENEVPREYKGGLSFGGRRREIKIIFPGLRHKISHKRYVKWLNGKSIDSKSLDVLGPRNLRLPGILQQTLTGTHGALGFCCWMVTIGTWFQDCVCLLSLKTGAFSPVAELMIGNKIHATTFPSPSPVPGASFPWLLGDIRLDTAYNCGRCPSRNRTERLNTGPEAVVRLQV